METKKSKDAVGEMRGRVNMLEHCENLDDCSVEIDEDGIIFIVLHQDTIPLCLFCILNEVNEHFMNEVKY